MRITRLGLRWKLAIVSAALAVAGATAVFVIDDDSCPRDSILHPPAAACIDPTALIVTGSVDEVNEAVAEVGGRVLPSPRGNMHYVHLRVDAVEELDRIKTKLEAAGFKVLYANTYELQ